MSKINAPENRIVNIDMDGTLFDFEHPIKLLLAEKAIDYADPTRDFYITKRYSDPELIEAIESLQNSEGFFRNLPPIEGAVEKWAEMQERGWHPRICSKPLSSNPFCTAEKLESVEYYFGTRAVDEAYIGRNKEDEPGITLIDDRPGLVNGRTWQRVIYTQGWNQHEEGLRLESWSDENLWSILAQCAERYDRLFS